MTDKPNNESGNHMGFEKAHGVTCGAKTRNGTPCQQPCVPGRPRCFYHGGASPAGTAHYKFKDGKHSRYLKDVPAELKAGYVASKEDEEITSIKEELAVCTALIQKRLADLKSRQLPPWGTVVEALNSLKVAPDEDKAERFAALETIIRSGYDAWDGEQQIINDIRELLQERSRLAAIEHRREVDLRCLVPVEATYSFLARIMQAIKETITDPAVFRRLNHRVMQLIPPSSPNGTRHAPPSETETN
jgi:hypothetical protein